jgi:hypothetical protein
MVFDTVTGSEHTLAFVPEVTFGTTPSTPSMQNLRHLTGFNLNPTKSTFQSEELGNNGQVADLRHGPLQNSGDMPVEMIYGEYDVLLAALLRGSWNTDVLKVGTVFPSFSLESYLQSGEYELFKGMLVNSLSLTVQPDAVVKGTFGLLAQNLSLETTAQDADPDASVAWSPFDAFTGTLSEGGSTISVVTGVSLDIQNNITLGNVVGSNIAQTKNRGKFIVTGTLSCYYEDKTLLQKFLNETESDLTLVLEDLDGNTLTIDLPRIKYTGATKDIGEEAVMQELPFQALYDSSDATSITLTRAAA